MKRYLFAILLACACSFSYAQSLTFEELQKLTNLTNDQVHNFLIISKGFKPIGTEVHFGKNYEVFKSDREEVKKMETVMLGEAGEMPSGNIGRQVFYYSPRIKDIDVILKQARQSPMTTVFSGSDKEKNIYRFDNSLFMSIISVGLDRTYGSVQLEEK
jgi:hypothetical protein